MTNNFDTNEPNDDFVEAEHGLGDESASPRGVGGNLAEAWRTKPLFKFTVLIVAVFAVFVAGFSFLSGGNSNTDISHLGHAPALKEAPGGQASPYMRAQTELANKERSEQALATGGSAMPTMLGQTAGATDLNDATKKEDPLNELRAETERLKQQVQQQQVVQQQQQQRQAEPFDDSLAQAMQHQMEQLLKSWEPQGIKQVATKSLDDLKNDEKNKSSAAASATPQPQQEPAKIIVNAGTVSYAQLLTEANSDVPGPILAQIVSGPLAGARAVGSFEVSVGYEKYLVLKFTLADKKGKDYSIDAIALDPNTTLGGMATEVDERYFVRVVLPAAAGFLQGMGQALGEGNSTITTNGSVTATTIASNGWRQGMYNGMGQAAQTMGQFFQNQANLTKPLVRVAAGTPMGLFFVAPVTDQSPTVGAQQQQTNGTGAIGVGNGVTNVNGYPGTTVNGYGGTAASSSPYPNYATPGAGYQGNVINRNPITTMGTTSSSYGQIYGQ